MTYEVNMGQGMKLSIIISLVFVSLAMLGYLYYGWLLLQTVMSGTSQWTTIEFSIRFILWLFPPLGLFILIVIEFLKSRRKTSNEVS